MCQALILHTFAGRRNPRGMFPRCICSLKAPGRLRQSSAPSTLRNFVPPGAAHEAAAGHTLSEPSRNLHQATTVGEESLQASSPQSQSYQASRVLRACGA